MNGFLLANVDSLALPVVTFAVMVACLTLLAVRAWRETTRAELSWLVLKALDGAIVLLLILFLSLVFFRFKTLA